jgi:hypothetical protein
VKIYEVCQNIKQKWQLKKLLFGLVLLALICLLFIGNYLFLRGDLILGDKPEVLHFNEFLIESKIQFQKNISPADEARVIKSDVDTTTWENFYPGKQFFRHLSGYDKAGGYAIFDSHF